MKKIVSIIMLTALLFTSITNGTTSKAISQYKRITSGNYEYAVLDEANKTATVLKIKPTKEVVIPKIIAGVAAALMVGVPLTRELVALYSWKFVFLGLIFIMLLSLAYFISYLPKGTHQNEVNLKLELQF